MGEGYEAVQSRKVGDLFLRDGGEGEFYIRLIYAKKDTGVDKRFVM